MRLFFDNNLPERLPAALRLFGIDALHIRDPQTGLSHDSTDLVWVLGLEAWQPRPMILTNDWGVATVPRVQAEVVRLGLKVCWCDRGFRESRPWEQAGILLTHLGVLEELFESPRVGLIYLRRPRGSMRLKVDWV